MKKLPIFCCFGTLLWLSGCLAPGPEPAETMAALLEGSPSLEGKQAYIQSPYVTAGDRAYLVGHQDGSFPELGWHIPGEMGGLWSHPVKLLDGFGLQLKTGGKTVPPGGNRRFVNYPMANALYWEPDTFPLRVERWQFIPDGQPGLIVEYQFENTGSESLTLEIDVTGHADLRPTWLGEETGMRDTPDQATFDAARGRWVVKDSANPWFVVFGSDRAPVGHLEIPESGYAGMGLAARLSYALDILPQTRSVLRMVFAGSARSQAEAENTAAALLENVPGLLTEKRDRYAGLANRSKLVVPDKDLEVTFEWLKYNADWMVRTVPGLGTGISAGIPDYPWWFGADSEYALQGYMAVGQTRPVFETIRLLDSVSQAVNGNGRIIHEMSTNGKVYNPGNINETPQFASLIWQVYRWNGDRAFLERYFPTVRKGLEWLMRENDANGNGYPDGFGMMEIHGLDSEMIDVASYTQAAFGDASKMARELGYDQMADEYARHASELKERINRDFWSEPFGSFADFLGTDAQALTLIEDAIVRVDTLNKPWAVAELEQTRQAIHARPGTGVRPFVLHHNWVVNTPMEKGIAETEKALKGLDTAREFTNPFGLFVTGIDRDASAGQDAGSFKGSKVFSYTGAVMTLPTGVLAVAENRYGRPDQALDYLQRMCRSFSYALPGSMYEVSPDYGMISQAWNLYSFAVPVVEQFFGIAPLASRNHIRIFPGMPSQWKEASLENITVGNNTLSVFYRRLENGRVHLKVTQTEPDWILEFPSGQAGQDPLDIRVGVPGTDEEGKPRVTASGGVLELIYGEAGR
ncbi:MAG TPA: hypothetical protein VLL47_11140 [Robiginitalea sp.]|nr:hypothetical protein [Robiginitalea sp.]